MGSVFTGFDDPTELEIRKDRPERVSHLLMPDGSTVDYQDADIGNVLSRYVLSAWLANVMEQEALPACERDEASGPRCDHCGEVTYFRRGISSGGGVSQWVHADTGQARCADGQGFAQRPVDHDTRRSA